MAKPTTQFSPVAKNTTLYTESPKNNTTYVVNPSLAPAAKLNSSIIRLNDLATYLTGYSSQSVNELSNKTPTTYDRLGTSSSVQSVVTDWTNPTNASILPKVGATINWTNINNVLLPDTQYSRAVSVPAAETNYILATGFYFDTAPIVAIQGIEVRVLLYGGLGLEIESSIKLYYNGLIGSDKSTGDIISPVTSTPAYMTYGGAADLWGTALTITQITSPDLGIALAYESPDPDMDIFVDNVQIRLYTTQTIVTSKSETGYNGVVKPTTSYGEV